MISELLKNNLPMVDENKMKLKWGWHENKKQSEMKNEMNGEWDENDKMRMRLEEWDENEMRIMIWCGKLWYDDQL